MLSCTLLLSTGGCAAWPRRWGGAPCCITTKAAIRRQPVGWHLFDVTVLEPLEQPFHLVRLTRRVLGVPIRALNLQNDRVRDSAFFTNRDPTHLSAEEARWGPSRPEDVPVPPLVVTKSKVEGKTPGFFVSDSRGARYLLKLDPVDAPELLSGAEVVTSKLLYALGYHVPSYEVAFIRSGELTVQAGATARDASGQARPFTDSDLRALLEPRVRDGKVRVVASKILDGEILGPASFKRFRDCTEIRALKIAYAWVNNIDAKDHNSLLVWNGKETVGYLIDFGTSLGADAGLAGPKSPCAGWTNIVDLREVSAEVVTLGLHQTVCDSQTGPVSSSVGLFSTHVHPDRWKPYAPNLAFDAMDSQDARWLASLMSRLSRVQLEAVVSAGQYSHPGDAAYLIDALERRRNIIVRYYLYETTPMREEQRGWFHITRKNPGAQRDRRSQSVVVR